MVIKILNYFKVEWSQVGTNWIKYWMGSSQREKIVWPFLSQVWQKCNLKGWNTLTLFVNTQVNKLSEMESEFRGEGESVISYSHKSKPWIFLLLRYEKAKVLHKFLGTLDIRFPKHSKHESKEHRFYLPERSRNLNRESTNGLDLLERNMTDF